MQNSLVYTINFFFIYYVYFNSLIREFFRIVLQNCSDKLKVKDINYYNLVTGLARRPQNYQLNK